MQIFLLVLTVEVARKGQKEDINTLQFKKYGII